MNLKRQSLRTLVAWVPLLLFLVLSKPGELPIVLLIIPFLLIFIAFYRSVVLLQLLWCWASGRAARDTGRMRAAVISSFLVVLAILGSLGQLDFKDVVTFGLLFGVAYFYVVRRRIRARSGG